MAIAAKWPISHRAPTWAPVAALVGLAQCPGGRPARRLALPSAGIAAWPREHRRRAPLPSTALTLAGAHSTMRPVLVCIPNRSGQRVKASNPSQGGYINRHGASHAVRDDVQSRPGQPIGAARPGLAVKTRCVTWVEGGTTISQYSRRPCRLSVRNKGAVRPLGTGARSRVCQTSLCGLDQLPAPYHGAGTGCHKHEHRA